MGAQSRLCGRFVVLLSCACVALVALAPSAAAAGVLRVGTFNGKAGLYTSIQKAVEKAKPGDFILVGPGDYKEKATQTRGRRGPSRGGGAGRKVRDPHPRHGP
jgi:ABC-type sugar transport system substrate-binding protein